MNKLFIIGLPRTGTTSVCAALLDLGFKVAHTAFSKHSFTLADVVADTPCYCDYPQLDALFPGSKFIYLNRDLAAWLPSVQMLLTKITPYIQPNGKFNPTIKRCFNHTFGLQETTNPLSDEHLTACYHKHRKQVNSHFKNRNNLLSIDISQNESYHHLIQFLALPNQLTDTFPHLNRGRMITDWKDIKHPNKINSDAFGPERRKFFDYDS